MPPQAAAARAATSLTGYSRGKGIYMKINYFNPEHTHALIDLQTGMPIEELVKR